MKPVTEGRRSRRPSDISQDGPAQKCAPRCRSAEKMNRCRCRCGGEYHGTGDPVIHWNGREYTRIRKNSAAAIKRTQQHPDQQDPRQFRMFEDEETTGMSRIRSPDEDESQQSRMFEDEETMERAARTPVTGILA